MKNSNGIFINFFAGISEFKDIPTNHMEAVLMSTTQVLKSAKSADKTKMLIRKTGAKQVMMDSGGYTVLTMSNNGESVSFDSSRPFLLKKKELNIAPCHVIEAATLLRPDIVIGLDYPIIKTPDPEIRKAEFNRKKKINLQWMIEISSLRQKYCPDIELYLPIQCYNLKQFAYFEGTLKDLKFDGLTFPTRNMTPMAICEFMIKIHEIGVRKVHLLGISNFSGIALATYFARHYFDRFSIDARSWSFSAQKRSYIDPDTLYAVQVGRKSEVSRREKLSCKCRRCIGRTYGDIIKFNNKEGRQFLYYHNHNAIKNVGKEFYKHAGNPEAFESYLRRRAPKRTKDIDFTIAALRMADLRLGS